MSKITYIAKEDLTEILDNVFAKYNIKISSGTTNVIKSTKATKAKKTKPKAVESDSYVIDGEQFTFNGVIVTKGDTYKNQTKGGKKLHTVVVQVTEEQKDAWTEWRKA